MLCASLAACAASGDEAPGDAALDPEDQPFVGQGKADGRCVDGGGPAALGVLALVNDPDVGVELLDDPTSAGGVGLHRRAAENIVALRPFADLQALDDVPWVGQASCRALASFACNVDRRCLAPLSTMTWNVEHFPLTDETEDAVVSILDELQPDVVGLQEVEDPAAFERVLARLPEYTGILGAPGPFTRVAVLVRTAAVDVLEPEHLFVDDWYAFPRPVLAVKLRPHGALDAATPTFAIVHLKAMGDSGSVSRRRNAVGKLRAWIDEQRDAGAGQILIVGDWNDELGDPPASNVFADLVEPAAHAAFLTRDAEEAGGVTLVPYGRMLDHVLATDELVETLQHRFTDVLELDDGWTGDFVETVSDHRPVVSVFDIPVRYDVAE